MATALSDHIDDRDGTPTRLEDFSPICPRFPPDRPGFWSVVEQVAKGPSPVRTRCHLPPGSAGRRRVRDRRRPPRRRRPGSLLRRPGRSQRRGQPVRDHPRAGKSCTSVGAPGALSATGETGGHVRRMKSEPPRNRPDHIARRSAGGRCRARWRPGHGGGGGGSGPGPGRRPSLGVWRASRGDRGERCGMRQWFTGGRESKLPENGRKTLEVVRRPSCHHGPHPSGTYRGRGTADTLRGTPWGA